ncbi:MAG TPA: arabinofuranosyltransferase, partial [Bacteroidia bacterium]|nr:arabinofuranosyltransferase [Bacteroidia bacterium]
MEINPQNYNGIRALLHPKVLISGGFALAFYCLIRAFEGVKFPAYPTQDMMPQTALLLMGLLAIAAMWLWQGKSWSYHLLAHLFAFGFGAATLMAWSSYDYASGGVGSDAWFSTAIAVKYKHQWGNTDFAYKGLNSFYPSLYQYLVGRFAALTHTSAVKAMKYGTYWTAFLLPLAAFGLWRKFLEELPAFLMIVVAMAICRIHLAFKPFEVIAMNVFIPWALYYVAGMRIKAGDGKVTWEVAPLLGRREILIGGLIGGLCFMTFYYYFFLFVAWIPIQILVEWRSGSSIRAIWARYRAFAMMIGVMMLVSAVYWIPLLADMARLGMASYQNRWFQHHMFGLPFDVGNQWKGMLGLLVLIGLAPFNRLARAVLVMFVALLAYLLIGHWAMYAGFPLLHFRMVGMEEYLLQLGLILGVLQLFQHFKGFLGTAWEKMFPVAIMVVFGIGMAMGFMWEKGNDASQAAANTEAPGLTPFPEFTALSTEKVFLTNRIDLVAFRPMYLFICPNAHYSHPASRYRERLKFLTLLSASKDADFVAWMLQYNRYDKVDYVMLDDNRMEIFDDNFPERAAHIKVS